MTERVLATFEIKYLQVMDEVGNVDKKLMPPVSNDTVRKMYEYMVLARTLDDTILKLQREGRAGVYAPLRGQEACQVGAAFALSNEDWLFPIYRDIAAMLVKGMPINLILQYFRGDERGMRIPDGVNLFPFAIPVSTQNPHAVGVGMAANIRGDKIAVMCFLGDGASSKGDFYEAANFAGSFNVPVVFVCENNQYAISVPRLDQTAAETLAQKAIACGFQGIQVDGNDIFAVYRAASEAVKKAKNGRGPTLIECYTYRMGDHTTADEASKYRSEEEVKEWEKKDPILRLEGYMFSQKIMNNEQMKKVREDCVKKVQETVEQVEKMPRQEVDDIFLYMYANMPDKLKQQLEYVKSFGEKT